MAVFDDEPVKRQFTSHEMGQDLSALSVHELNERIELLRAEILRLEATRDAKSQSRNAADAFFCASPGKS